MTWLGGLCAEFKIAPIQGQIRLAVFPGLAYTFVAWREVQARDTALIHPMDADNVQKPTTDALQTHRGGRTTKESRDLEPEPYGAYINDTQVVDLLVFRLPQEGKAAHDRAEIRKVRVRKIRENRIARARQKEIEAQGSAEPQLSENSISAE